MRSWFLALLLAVFAAGALAQPAEEGVDVKKSRLRLLPASMVERSAAQQYNDLMRQAGAASALREFGFLSGPQEARIRGRSRTLSVWLWRNDSSGDESSLMR